MATRIRLKRYGAKKQPYYRIVVMDQRKSRDGRAVEEIGAHNPGTDPPATQINEDRALHWLLLGAQPSDTVRALFSRQGLMQRLHEAKKPAAESAPQ